MPYVGGKTITLSTLGSQKTLKIKSNTSSLPFPKSICSSEIPLILDNASLTKVCCGSGYLFKPVSKGFSFASIKTNSEDIALNSSLAEE